MESLIRRVIARATAVSSPLAIAEAERNVILKRPAQAAMLEMLLAKITAVPDVKFQLPIALAEKDRHILCAAIGDHCSHLVTGDKKDFGHLYGQKVGGVLIVPPDILASILIEDFGDKQRLT